MSIPLHRRGNSIDIRMLNHTPDSCGNSNRTLQFTCRYGLTVLMGFPMTWPRTCQSVRTVRRLGDHSGARNFGKGTNSKPVHRWLRGENPMMKTLSRLGEPASESQLAVALTVAAVAMGLMLCAIMWQSTIIGSQRDVIQWMWSAKFGG